MNKEYLTIIQQIDHLSNEKGIDKNSIQEKAFKEKSYLDLISSYTEIISTGKDITTGKKKYIIGESFDKFIECNLIDDAISSFLRHALGTFEKTFKSFLMNTYCQKMHDNGDFQTKDYLWINDYLDEKQIFDLLPLKEKLDRGIIQLLSDTDLIVTKRKEVLNEILKESKNTNPSNLMAKHYLRKYGYIPMYVIIHMLSFGKLLTLFEMLPLNDRIKFVRYYYNDSTKRVDGIRLTKTENDFKTLIIIRNITNHNEPIFPFVLNYRDKRFKGLLDVLSVLKKYYVRSSIKSDIEFNNLNHISFNFNPYPTIKIEKIHKIIDVIK